MAINAHNSLYPISATTGGLLTILLTLGAYGHFAAIWLQLVNSPEAWRSALLALPGLMLAATAAINLLLFKPLWQTKHWALWGALTANALTLCYLVWLMWRGVPNHPIGVFLTLQLSYVIMLSATAAGLRWPNSSNS